MGKILIVDDIASARKVVKRLLSAAGYTETLEAANGEEALDLVSKNSVSLIISDRGMPKLDGIGLVRALKAHTATKDIPFIMITSSAEKDAVTEALSAGVTDYIAKPFSVDTITSKLSTHLTKE